MRGWEGEAGTICLPPITGFLWRENAVLAMACSSLNVLLAPELDLLANDEAPS
jgi:hypothetical protein